jgi:GntR family transcriptional regulator
MSLELRPTDIYRMSDTPLYRQIAELVDAAIEDGRLAPGDPIPSESEMERGLGVSTTVVRAGLAELVTAGRLVRRQGAPTRVADPPRMRDVDAERYQRALNEYDEGDGRYPLSSAFVADHGADWAQLGIQTDYKRGEKATATDAQYLGCKPGTAVLRRRFVKTIDGQALELQRSTVRWTDARGTVLVDPKRQPYPGGTVIELVDAGFRAVRVELIEWARMPTAEERALFQQVGPVWDIVRIMSARVDDEIRPVEVSRVIMPTATNRLRSVIELH